MRTYHLLLILACLPLRAAAQPITFSATVRARAESWDWFGTDPRGKYNYGGVLARAALSQQQHRLGWRVELAAPLLLGLPDDAATAPPAGQLGAGASYWVSNDSATATGNVFLKQAFVRLGSNAHYVRAGRIEFVEGTERTPADSVLAAVKRERIAHRLLGNFAWSHVQRSLDGVHYSRAIGNGGITAVGARPTEGVFRTNGWGSLDVTVLYGSGSGGGRSTDWRAFGMYYLDERSNVVKTDNRPAPTRAADRADISFTTLGGNVARTMRTAGATFDVLAWGAFQLGDWGVQEHRAYSWVVEAGVQPRMALRPWLRAGYTVASGDGDPADGRHETFHPMLPTPRLYAKLPFYNQMNLRDAYVTASVQVTPRLSLRSEVHRLRLDSSADLWYAGGGAYEDGTFGMAGRPSNGATDLAMLVDISAQLRVSPSLGVNAYFGSASAGRVPGRIHGEGRGSLGYLEAEWRR